VIRPRVGLADLHALRRLVARVGGCVRLHPERQQQLVLAVNEAVTNAIRHATGHARVTIAHDSARRHLVVEVSDQGEGIPPEVVAQRPAPEATGGRGLYLVQVLCDHVEILTSTAGQTGTVVRMIMAIDG
jgi:anti-sigma regulatory factor (Ser/Thr protein kinase)